MRARTFTWIALTTFALGAAGCGGGSSTTAATRTASASLAYSQCMHSHGEPNFPDPSSSGEIHKADIAPLVNTPQFQPAQRACQHVLPNGAFGSHETAQQTHTRLVDALSFARCMRSHGLLRFPDPTDQGELSVAMVRAQGIDVHSPAVLQNAQACLPASHGWLTAAQVRRALSDAGN